MEDADDIYSSRRFSLENREEHPSKDISSISQLNHQNIPVSSSKFNGKILSSQKVFINPRLRATQWPSLDYLSLPHYAKSAQLGYKLPSNILKRDNNQIDVNHLSATSFEASQHVGANADTTSISAIRSLNNLFENQADKPTSLHFQFRSANNEVDSKASTPVARSQHDTPLINISLAKGESDKYQTRKHERKGLYFTELNGSTKKTTINSSINLLDPTEAKSILFVRNPETGRWDYSNYDPMLSKERMSGAEVKNFFKRVEQATQKHYEDTFTITSFVKSLFIGVPAIALVIVGIVLVALEASNFGTIWTPQLTAGVALTITGGIFLVLSVFCGYHAYEVKKAQKKYNKALEEVITQQNAAVATKRVEWVLNPVQDSIELKMQ